MEEQTQQSFDKIKMALVSAPILTIVDPTKPFVETSASDKAIGAILLQEGKLALKIRTLTKLNKITLSITKNSMKLSMKLAN